MSDMGIRDSVKAVVNPTDLDDDDLYDMDGNVDENELARRNTRQPGPAPERPADGASKATWVDYVVRALGADRGSLVGEVRRFDDERGDYVQPKALTKDELIKLAETLGG